MNKIVLAVIEWFAYVIAALAIGSLLRITVVVKPGANSAPPNAPTALVAQDARQPVSKRQPNDAPTP